MSEKANIFNKYYMNIQILFKEVKVVTILYPSLFSELHSYKKVIIM
jgi:hypothetical protein